MYSTVNACVHVLYGTNVITLQIFHGSKYRGRIMVTMVTMVLLPSYHVLYHGEMVTMVEIYTIFLP